MSLKYLWKGFFIFFLVFSAQTDAAQKNYKAVGVIRAISPDSIWVDTDTGTLEFSRRQKGAKIPPDAKTGDPITIWYTLSPQKVLMDGNSNTNKQQPGQADPVAPGIILDDRAFYDAKNIDKKNESS